MINSNNKSIVGYKDLYIIHDTGEIFSSYTNKLLKTDTLKNGYKRVTLYLDKKPTKFLVHRLVAQHFIVNPYNHPQVNHKNGNKLDNRASNLEWTTALDNMRHALKTGLKLGYISFQDKTVLIDRVISGELLKDLASAFNRSPESLAAILRRHAKFTGKEQAWKLQTAANMRKASIKNLNQWNQRKK